MICGWLNLQNPWNRWWTKELKHQGFWYECRGGAWGLGSPRTYPGQRILRGDSIWKFFQKKISFLEFKQGCCSVTKLCLILCITAHQASLSFTTSQSLFKLMSIESVMPSNHLILCHPLLLLPSIFPSIRVFSNEIRPLALCIRWPKYWSFSFSISPSNEYSRLIYFRIDCFPYCPRDSWESSSAPQFERITSSAFSLLHDATLISIHDYWNNHSFDSTDICQQSDVCFLICCLCLS